MTQARRVRLVLRRIEPWTVLKFSLFLYASLYLVLLVAAVTLWTAASITGLRDSVESFVGDLVASKDFHFQGGELLRASVIGGTLLVLVGSGVTVLLTVLHNLISDLMGGLGVVFEERPTRHAAARAPEAPPARSVWRDDELTTPIDPTPPAPKPKPPATPRPAPTPPVADYRPAPTPPVAGARPTPAPPVPAAPSRVAQEPPADTSATQKTTAPPSGPTPSPPTPSPPAPVPAPPGPIPAGSRPAGDQAPSPTPPVPRPPAPSAPGPDAPPPTDPAAQLPPPPPPEATRANGATPPPDGPADERSTGGPAAIPSASP